MKTRNGFVSNSSSSIVIIAFTKSKKCPTCGRSDPDFLDLLERGDYSEDNRVAAIGMQDIIEEKTEWVVSERKENIRKEMEKLLKPYNKKKYTLAAIEISYHDGTLKKIFDDMIKNGTAIVLEKDD